MTSWAVILILSFSAYHQDGPRLRVLLDHLRRDDCVALAEAVNRANTLPGARAVCVQRDPE